MRPSMITSPLLAALVACSLTPAFAQKNEACDVEPFQGATLPQGAVAEMTVTEGHRCGILNYGASGRTHPADSGSITRPPAHGTATFDAPRARYAPQPGYVGDDEFSYEAYAKGEMDQPRHLRVKVKVKVVAP